MLAQHLQRLARGCAPPALVRRVGELGDGAVHAHLENLRGGGQPPIFAVMQQIRPETPDIGDDGLARFRMRPDLARQAQQLHRPVQRQLALGQIPGNGAALGLLALAHFDIGAETSRLFDDVLPCFWMLAQHLRPRVLAALVAAGLAELARIFALRIIGAGDKRPEPPTAQRQLPVAAHRAGARIGPVGLGREQHRLQELVQRRRDVGRLLLHHLGGLGLEVAPKGFQHRLPLGPAAGNFVQLVLQPSGEVIGHIAFEEALQERRHQPPAFFGEEAVLLHPHIIAVLQHLERGGIGGWTPDPQFLQLLDQRCFRIARRRLGEMLLGRHLLLRRRVARRHAGQQLRIIILAVVPAFLIQRQEPRKDHHLPGRAQPVLSGCIHEIDGGAFQPRRRHLARQRPLEDQVIKPRMIAAAHLVASEVGRPNRLMRLLRILGLGLILTRLFRQIAAVIALRDGLPCGRDCAAVHLHAVGTHIGYRAILVELLRDSHRMAGGKAELARRLLLQGGGRERRRRVARNRLGFDLIDGEAPRLHVRLRGHGVAFPADGQPLDLLAFPAHQPRSEALPALLHLGRDGPIFLGHEAFDLTLAVHHQPQRHRLHAPRRFRARQLAPQHRRERKAHQIVERPPRPVGVDQILVQGTRMRHGFGHRLLGDRVEGHAVHLLGQRLLRPQHFLHVPADRFPFAIGVGGQDQAVGLLRLVGDGLELLALVAIIFPRHGKAVVRIHRPVLRRQVADMAIAGEHMEIAAQIFLDGLRLGWRFNDDKLHSCPGSEMLSRTRASLEGEKDVRQASPPFA